MDKLKMKIPNKESNIERLNVFLYHTLGLTEEQAMELIKEFKGQKHEKIN